MSGERGTYRSRPVAARPFGSELSDSLIEPRRGGGSAQEVRMFQHAKQNGDVRADAEDELVS
jgi:hypothetical protein